MSEVDVARRARKRGDGRTWRDRALQAEEVLRAIAEDGGCDDEAPGAWARRLRQRARGYMKYEERDE